MKKLWFRLIIIAVAVCGLAMALSSLYMLSLEKYALNASGMPETIQVANTGNSHGLHAFDYSGVQGGFNFALGSQPPQYDLSLVRRYISRFAEGSTLFIPVSYTSLWGDPTADSQYEALAMRYMGLLDADGLVLKSQSDYFVLKYFSILRYADVQTHSIFHAKTDRVADASESGLTLDELGVRRAAYHAFHAYDDGVLTPLFEPSVDAIRDMIALCQEHGVNSVLVTTPYTRAYADAMPEDLLSAFYDALNGIAEELGVPYVDYSRDERFVDALFEDSDHLNEDGARLFTQLILDEYVGGDGV